MKAKLFLIFFLLFSSFLGFSASSSEKDNPPPRKRIKNEEKKRLAVFLDLDQTLVYTRRHELDTTELKKNGHESFEIEFLSKTKRKKYTVFLRPGVRKFLETCTSHFDTYIFTAAKEAYTQAIMEKLDKEKRIKRVFSRESCLKFFTHGNIFYVKDLNTVAIEQPIERRVLVDDHVISFKNNISNGILLKSWKGEKTDLQKFHKLLDVLSILSRKKDVRTLLGRFNLEERCLNFLASVRSSHY